MATGSYLRRRFKAGTGSVSRINGITVTGTGTQASVSTTGLTIVQGDVLVVAFELDGSAVNQILTGFSGDSSGAYANQKDLYANSTVDTNLFTATQIQGATADTTITVSWSSGTSLSWRARIVQFRGVDQTTPMDAAATTATGTATDRADAPSITTVTPNAMVVACLGAQAGSTATALTGPANMSNFVESSGGGSRVASCDNLVASPGAFDPNACTGGNNAATDSWAAVTYALRPA